MPNASSPPLRVVIIGAGIAGVCAAVGLLDEAKRTGRTVTLYVADQARGLENIGAGVSLGPNAATSLKLMGAGEALRKAAKERDPTWETWFDFFIAEKTHKTPGAYVCTVKSDQSGEGNVNVHRADFINELSQLLPADTIHFRKRFKSYTNTPSGVTVEFEDGEIVEADVLIASDGIKSSVRRQMYEKLGLPEESQRAAYSHWVAWRGLIPREKYEEIMGKGRETKLMHLGNKKHILTFPVRGGQLVNLVGFVQDLDERKLGTHTSNWSEERPKEEMLEDFEGFSDECLQLLSAIETPSVWGIFSLPPIPVINDGAVLLIGDSASATTPHQGSGAGQAIEAALFISRLLSSPEIASSNEADRPAAIQNALEVYAEVRHPRAQKVQKTSRECGLLYEFAGVNGEGDDIEKIRESLEFRLRWIWNYALEEEVQKAVDRL